MEGTKSRAYRRHSAFAPFFASTWLHSLPYAEVSGSLKMNPATHARAPLLTVSCRDCDVGLVLKSRVMDIAALRARLSCTHKKILINRGVL